ncbi:hypothetical protein [Burkholderia sp. WTPI3]|uniref:hypothetical protein n=1 Tax=Burkholderia sp. WTPI3 TaxID=2822167 RepID=UPI001F38CB4C|nr:hypothetical protein [Burkholderia sp. WTPI3]
MLTAILNLFGGRKAAAQVSDEPPLELQTIIGGASVYERASNDPEWPGDRLMLHTARGSFFLDKADDWLKSGWPMLTDAQRARAKKMISAHVAVWQQRQSADAAAAGRGRTNYATTW